MCGIGGLIFMNEANVTSEVKTLITNLLTNMETRGRDATGVALIDTNNNTKIFKTPTKASEFVKDKRYDSFLNETKKVNVVLLHTRAATNGSEKKNVNNHPHYNKTTGNTLVHNGVISNDDYLSEKYDLDLDGKCDSEVILKLIDKVGFNKAMKKLSGSWAIAHYNKNKKTVSLFKGDCSPLYLVYLNNLDCFLFASTETIITQSLNILPKESQYGLIMDASLNLPHLDFLEGDKVSFNLDKKKVYSEFIFLKGGEHEKEKENKESSSKSLFCGLTHDENDNDTNNTLQDYGFEEDKIVDYDKGKSWFF